MKRLMIECEDLQVSQPFPPGQCPVGNILTDLFGIEQRTMGCRASVLVTCIGLVGESMNAVIRYKSETLPPGSMHFEPV